MGKISGSKKLTTAAVAAIAILLSMISEITYASQTDKDFFKSGLFRNSLDMPNGFAMIDDIAGVNPNQNSINVARSENIVITFTMDMNASTVTGANIKVIGHLTGFIQSSMNYNPAARTVTIDPLNDFQTGEEINVILTPNILKSNGDSIEAFQFKFTASVDGGSGHFSSGVQISLQEDGNLSSVAGDFDGDNDIDVCFVVQNNMNTKKLFLVRNTGNGSFDNQPILISEFGSDYLSSTLIALDCDGDGDLDLAIGTEGGLKRFKNNGAGIFTETAMFQNARGSLIASGDMDGDGDHDIISLAEGAFNPGEIIISANDGNGNFSAGLYGHLFFCDCIYHLSYTSFTGVNVEDFDNDGDQDVVISGLTTSLFPKCRCDFSFILYNSGNGVEYSHIDIVPAFSETIVSGNVNSDGFEDFLGGSGSVFRNVNGTGQFLFSTYANPSGSILLHDYDGDGDLDIASHDFQNQQLNVLGNNGSGVFTQLNSSNLNLSPRGMSSADFDGDGDLDIAGKINLRSSGLSILFNDYLCSISGFSHIPINSESVFRSIAGSGRFWTLSNYGSTAASIIGSITNDSLVVSAGSIGGHFVLYYSDNMGVLCHKHVFVEDPLPVEMASFTSGISGRDVTLNWTTSSETNNSGFEIQRAFGKGQYLKISFVTGNGTSSIANSYSYIDKGLSSGNYNYRLKQSDFNGNFEYFNLSNEVVIGIPGKFDLSQNYPNPFNPSTKINFDVPVDSRVSINLFDMSGKEVASLTNEVKAAGYYTLEFNASELPSGIYFYRIIADGNGSSFISTKKMTLIK